MKECYRVEGVNHLENCKHIVSAYLESLQVRARPAPPRARPDPAIGALTPDAAARAANPRRHGQTVKHFG